MLHNILRYCRWFLRSGTLLGLVLFLTAQTFLPGVVKDLDRDHPLLRGVVLWWPTIPQLAGGPIWWDVIGSNHGFLTNMDVTGGWRPSSNPAVGGAILFDGFDDTIEASDQPNIQFERTNRFSIAVWFNTTNTAFQNMVRKARDSDNAGWWLNMLPGGQFEGGLITPTEALFRDTVSTGWNNGRNHVVMLTYDGSSTDIGLVWYIDGNVQSMSTPYATSIVGTSLTTEPLRLGTAFGASYYSGSISQLMICACTWSAVQVKQLAAMQAPTYSGIIPDSLALLSQALAPCPRTKRKVTIQ